MTVRRLASVIVLFGGLWRPTYAQSGADLFQQALSKERAEGQIQEAIQVYERIAREFSANRALAARALLQIGRCYERLGREQAQKALTSYDRLLREYADQHGPAEEARERSASLRSMASRGTQTARQIWTGPDVDPRGSVSPDGRYVGFTDWKSYNLAVRDLSAGTTRRLTTAGKPPSGDYAYRSAISPDGQQIAYAWFDSERKRFELRILPLSAREGTAPRIIRSADGDMLLEPYAWTPDGQRLVVFRGLADRSGQIATVSVQTGSIQVLKSIEWRYPVNASLSPDGRYIAYDVPGADRGSTRDIFLLAIDGSRETAAVQHPANDVAPVWSPDGRQLMFLSDRTGNDALWAVPIEGGRPMGAARLVKPDVGAFLPVGTARGGSLYYSSGGRRINTYVAAFDDTGRIATPPAPATERFINSNGGPAWSPDGGSLAYFLAGRDARLVVRNLTTAEERDIPTRLELPPANGSSPRWFPDGRAVLVALSEPDRAGLGYYRIQLSTGATELLHRTNGKGIGPNQPDLSPDGRAVFYIDYGESPDDARIMRLDLAGGGETELKRSTAGQSFVELAVSPDGAQIAYVAYDRSSRIMSLEVMRAAGGESRSLMRVPRESENADDSIAWSADQRSLFFARPESAASDRQTLWRIPVAGGDPQKTGLSVAGQLRFVRVHPDGRRIAFETRESAAFELWVLENFWPAAPSAAARRLGAKR